MAAHVEKCELSPVPAAQPVGNRAVRPWLLCLLTVAIPIDAVDGIALAAIHALNAASALRSDHRDAYW